MKRYFFIGLLLLSTASNAQNSWSIEADFAGAGRGFAVSFAIGNKIYVGTGADESFNAMADFWEYDPVGDVWTQKADFEGDARFGAVGFSIKGKGYIALGAGSLGAALYKDVWEYDPVADDWEPMDDFEGDARLGATVFVMGNKAYVGTGQAQDPGNPSESIALNDFWEFDPAAVDNWVQKNDFPGTGRFFASAFSIGSRGYLGGGADTESNAMADFWQYHPAEDSWTQKADLGVGATIGVPGFCINGRGYIGALSNFWEYDPSVNLWTKRADISAGWLGSVGVSANGKGYIGTGLGDTPKKLFYEFTPVGPTQTTFGGKMYGPTSGGGLTINTIYQGVIFEANANGAGLNVIHQFDGGSGNSLGYAPFGRQLALNGKLYGTTTSGGTNDYGILYELNLTGNVLTKLQDFSAHGSNGSYSGLTFVEGKLYGMAGPGSSAHGIVFEYDPVTTTFAKKLDFGGANGSYPKGDLVLVGNKLYGMTSKGGASDKGVIFEYDFHTNTLTKKIDFTGSNGSGPEGALIEFGGILYGLTVYGGASDKGVLFEYDVASGILTKKKDFTGGNGEFPSGSLVLLNETLYGLAPFGGANGDGAVFAYDPANNDLVKKFDLDNTVLATGSNPRGSLTAINGKLYGYTHVNGGSLGTLFEYDPAAGYTVQNVFIGTNGGFPLSAVTFVRDNQTLVFDPLPAKFIGDAPFDVAAGPSMNFPVSFSSSNPAVATMEGQRISIVGSGTTYITAHIGRDNHFTSVSRLLTVSKHSQSITFDPLDAKIFGDANFDLTANASSGLPVIFESSNTGVATISGNTVTIVGIGTTTITAKQAGNAFFSPAADVSHPQSVAKLSQTITFPHPDNRIFGDPPFDLDAMASSGLTVSYLSSNTGVATVSGATVTIVGAGTTTFTASQAGNANVHAATSIDENMIVTKANQTTTFNALPSKETDDPDFDLTATASSGLPVSYESSNHAVATIAGSTVSIHGEGSTLITASQAGNANYFDALNVFRFLNVTKVNQTITFDAIPQKNVGDVFNLTATASSGLTVSYSSGNTGVATISGNTVTVVGYGTTTITASQGGNSEFGAAPSVDRILTVKAQQTITFNPLAVKTIGDANFTLSATSSSGLAVIYTSSNPGVASVSGNTVTINAIGLTTISANQSGDDTYSPAPEKNQLLTIKNVTQTPIQQGHLWGMTAGGGAHEMGTIFKTNGDGSGLLMAHEFKVDGNGAFPENSALTLAANGKMYGVATQGGEYNGGVIFEFDPATGTVAKKFDFDLAVSGSRPVGSLVLLGGKLFGVTGKGGTSARGIIFEYDPATNTFTKKLEIPAEVGSTVVNGLVDAGTGRLWGTMMHSSVTNGKGSIFEYNPTANTIKKWHDFTGTDGSGPVGLMRLNYLIGVTSEGGANNAGVLFEVDPTNGAFVKKFDFDAAVTGAGPSGSLTRHNSHIYGFTNSGGANSYGTLFDYETISGALVKKIDVPAGGGKTYADLVRADNGKLYGLSGVEFAKTGSLFEYTPESNVYTEKVALNVETGAEPTGNMILHNGKLYGLTRSGGDVNSGVLFEYDVSGNAYTKKFSFSFASNGANPSGALTQASNGKFYGVTIMGGAKNNGTIFELDPATGVLTKRFDFDNETIGSEPYASLTLALNGKLYGSTRMGTPGRGGALFEFDPATNTTQIVHHLNAELPGGWNMEGRLTLAPDGKLWGMTPMGGVNITKGIIFSYDPKTGVFSKRYDLSNDTGAFPEGAMAYASNGKLYGVTWVGGTNNKGTLFEFDPVNNTLSKKHDFSTDTGENPAGDLTEANGKLYGIALGGGTGGYGTLFEYDPATETLTKKVDFIFSNGASTRGSLLRAANGKLYAVTDRGGVNGRGVVFEYDPLNGVLTVRHSFKGSDGGYPFLNALTQAHVAVRQDQTITFGPLVAKKLSDPSFAVTATATSSLDVQFSTVTDKVTVSGNQVTIVKSGSVTIRANQPGNANYNPAPTVEQMFCVEPAKPTITLAGEDTDNIVLTSNNATGNQWFLNGTVIPGATDATYNPTAAGVYKVQVSIDGCVSEFSSDLPLIVTGNYEAAFSKLVSVYPNPAVDKLRIVIPDNKGSRISIFHLSGKTLENTNTDKVINEVDVHGYASGIYFLQIINPSGQYSGKFIKK